MPTREELFDQAETIAAHKACEVYMETLRDELKRLGLGTATVMEALGTTTHVHTALMVGERPGVLKYGFHFDESPKAVEEAKKTAGLVEESKSVVA